jgi:hypothetical protein
MPAYRVAAVLCEEGVMKDYRVDNGDGVLVPATLEQWGKWASDINKGSGKRVASTEGDGWLISTVCLGMDHSNGDGSPLWYETMLFLDDDGPRDGECERYGTREEAQKGHDAMVLSMDAT